MIGYDYTGYGVSMNHDVRPSEEQTYIDIESVYDWTCDYADGKLIPTGIPANHIIVYGQSVGSGPSCHIASGRSHRPLDGTFVGLKPITNPSKPVDDVCTRIGDADTGANDGIVTAPLVDSAGCCCCYGPSVTRHVAGTVLHSPILSGIRVLTSRRCCLACCDIYPNVDMIKNASSPVFVIHGEKDTEVGFHHGQGLHEQVPPTHRTQPWWVPDRGHNDILLDNEEEFFARMKRFLITVRNRQLKRESSDKRASNGSTVSVTVERARGESGSDNGSGREEEGLSMVERLKRSHSKGVKSNIGLINQAEKNYADIVTQCVTQGQDMGGK